MSDDYDYSDDILIEVWELINRAINRGDWQIDLDNCDPTATMDAIEYQLTSHGWELNDDMTDWVKKVQP